MTNIPVLGNSTSGTKAFFLLVSDEVAAAVFLDRSAKWTDNIIYGIP